LFPSRPARFRPETAVDAPTSPIRRLPYALALAVSIALAACTGPAGRVTIPPDATQSIAPATSATPAPDPAPSPQPFPVTLTDDEGTDVTIAEEPARIVSLTPATTEILFYLGVGDRIVGKVEDLTLHPPEAAAIPDVAKFGEVNLEQLVALEPDLVIAGGNFFTPPDAIERLRDLELSVLVVYAPTVEQVFTDIVLTGRAVGRSAEAADLVASMRARFDQVAAATRTVDPPRVFYEIDATGAYYGPADASFLAEMIELAGGDPITTGSPDKFDISQERLIEADPEVILLGDAAYGVTAEQVAARPGWEVMTAVREGNIRPIDDIIVTRPGPRLADGLDAMLAGLHPDLAPAASPSAAP
jgi:iron complex transport system substrate-binding protein